MLHHILRAFNEPLLIEPALGARFVSVFGRKLLGEEFSGADLHAELQVAGRSKAAPRAPGIAVIPVYGVIAQRANSLGTSTDDVSRMVDQALADPSVDAILYDHDSGGGTVSGVPETAAKIRAAAAVKPSLALSNSLMASASYWLGAAAGEVWVTPSGEGAGSIGVWTAHEDWSAWFEQEGVKVTEFSAGAFKTEGAPWKPLTDEAKAFLQDRVAEVYAWFVKDVAADRGASQTAVREGYGQGRVLAGVHAVDAGLADRVGTFEEAVARLSQRVKSKSRGPRAEIERRRLDLDRLAS